MSHLQKGSPPRVIVARDLNAIAIQEDGDSITSTSRTSQVGGAVVGGLLLGGAGALVGGLTGKTTTKGRANRLGLQITIRDLKAPLHEVNFLARPALKGSRAYKDAAQAVQHW